MSDDWEYSDELALTKKQCDGHTQRIAALEAEIAALKAALSDLLKGMIGPGAS